MKNVTNPNMTTETYYFYEVVKTKKTIKLIGPLEGMKFVIPQKGKESPHKYVQVLDGKVAAVFTDSEILVLSKEL